MGKLGDKRQQQHRGFGFVTFTTQEQYQTAIDSGTVRGSISAKSHRKYTLYIRPVIRSDDSNNNNYYSGSIVNEGNVTTTIPKEDELKNICFLWTKHRCPYGSNCKFIHVGEGGCSTTTSNGDDVVTAVTKTKKKKHNKDDDNKTTTTKEEKDKSQIDCINYKNKGKCRKGDKCPYRHDANSLRNNKKKQQLLSKQLGEDGETSNTKEETTTTMKKRQSLSIRVFGLNYTTTEQDVHDYFTHCGKIMEITFPTYDDSGRSKGYCGVLFTSPKAVEKAVALDGGELHGRWLRIQEGKMYLKKWEEAENIRSSRKEGNERLGNTDDVNSGGDCEKGEYGQKVKRRKKHGFKDE
jgi:RNA recognition motif-containing protein